MINVAGSMEGLRASKVGISVPNRVAISPRLSPCCTVYSNGPEGVGVIDGEGVSVGGEVGVMVGVLVGGNGVAVAVKVTVGVIVGVGAAFNGEFSPVNQKISAAAPAMSRIAAPIMMAIGVLCRIC